MRYERLSNEETLSLLRETRPPHSPETMAAARGRLVELTRPLAFWIVGKRRGRLRRSFVASVEDAQQEAMSVVVGCVDTFDLYQSSFWVGYVTQAIHRRLNVMIIQASSPLWISNHAATVYSSREDRRPADADVRRSVSAGAERLGSLPPWLHPSCPDPVAEFVDRDDAAERAAELMRWVNALPPRTAYVLTRRFGLDGNAPLETRDVGAELSLSMQRVRQIMNGAIRELRAAMSAA